MNELKKVEDVIRKLLYILSGKQKLYALLILIMSIFAAIFETLGVAVIMPVLDMMMDIQGVKTRWYMKPFVNFLNLDSDQSIIWFVCLGVVSVYILKTLYFTFFSWVSCKYSLKVQRELGVRVLSSYLKQGYLFFVENNTSRLVNGIASDTSSIYGILKTIFSSFMKLLTIISVGAYIMIQSPNMAMILLFFALLSVVLIYYFYRKPMSENGKIRRELISEMNQVELEAIQGHKEVLVMNKQEYFAKTYAEVKRRYSNAAVKIDMGTTMPAYLIEMIFISGMMIAVAVQMDYASNVSELITKLSAIAAGGFRILPALGAISSGMNTIITSTPQLNACYETISQVKNLEQQEQEKLAKRPSQGIRFQRELTLRNISFSYPKTKENVLSKINLTIHKGESIALIGPSGAGKTTLSDIILALLKPTSGSLMMDGIDVEELGTDWNRIIGYVPQASYIVDNTIRHNIAFGERDQNIDDEQIWRALKIAQLDEFVRELPAQLDTRVGERGVRFSGGQRQRLAIARALYRDPDILVLDEATASLDNETEAEVMEAIEALQGYKTLIIVAHRLSTIRKCDAIYEVRDQKVTLRNKGEIF